MDPDINKEMIKISMFVFVLATSPISVLSSFLILGHDTPIRALNVSVMIASILYWRHPVHGFRRNLDMTLVSCNMLTHYALCLRRVPFFILLYAPSHWIFYILSWRSFHRGDVARANVYWMLLHLSIHLLNTYMYHCARVPQSP